MMRPTAMVMGLAGFALGAGAQVATLESDAINPKEAFAHNVHVNLAPGVAGRTVRGSGREIINAFDTRFSGYIDSGTGQPFTDGQKTNYAHVNGANYSTVATGSGYYWRIHNASGPGQDATGSLRFDFVDDNGTPTNPNDDVTTNAITDCVFDDYAFEPGIAARYGPGELATVTQVRTTWRIGFTAPEDVNNTPSNPNDDLFTRTHTLLMNFWEVDDNGTPTNPNDDFPAFVSGFTANFSASVAAAGVLQGLTINGFSGSTIPTGGIVSYDWANNQAAFGRLGSDSGIGIPALGGDDLGDGNAQGQDGIAVPNYDLIYRTGGEINTYDSGAWAWAPTATASLIDPGADGNASDTTYTDILLTGNTVNWSLGVAADSAGNPGSDRVDYPGQFHLVLQVDAPEGCAADLTGSSDPNDPTYGAPDGDQDADDFFFYLDQFVANNLAAADLTGSSDPNDPSYGVPNGIIDADDFFVYLDLFVQPCP
ncbi:MAG: hypothetical protein IT439_10935 [Phycisphaerales bacterium]|nr:hypothetical protein [Phycisphaerales bacterium]